jgi:surfactin synthase thioesterase subunit
VSGTTLVCLGFAGSGASFFHPWKAAAPEGLSILAPQLPGREWRIDEEPPADVESAADALLPEVVEACAGGRVAVFGQCFGAILAFELARRLSTVEGARLVHLFPSGSLGPWTPRPRWATGVDDDELVRRVREDIGYDHEALAYPELRAVIVPSLRADMESHEKYVAPPGAVLDVPITALRGRQDPVVTADEAGEWAKATTAAFDLAEFDGPHMYLIDEAPALLSVIAAAAGRNP